MIDGALQELAQQAGIAVHWRDAFGQEHEVSPDTLRAVLNAIGLPANTDAEIADSRAQIAVQQRGLLPLTTADEGSAIRIAATPGRFKLTFEDGTVSEGEAWDGGDGQAVLPPIAPPGYHQLELGGAVTTLAVAPSRCFTIADAGGLDRPWGLAVQLYALRRHGDLGIGDFAALRDFVACAARHGAQAVAISPVHAQFSADPNRFSPYAPSSRITLNVLHADAPPADRPEDATRLESLDLIDWPQATRTRLRCLQAAFAAFRANEDQAAFEAFRREQGDLLERHARFEALHAHQFGADPQKWNWRTWPAELRDPTSPAVAAFASDHAEEVAFHAWLQFRADRGLAAAQAAARRNGMKIGLISDLAVGTDAGGSHAWSRQQETLIGLTIGAPPDPLGPQGQDWGLAAFSPRGLQQHGYSAFLEMLRIALRHAGGVRVDHVMGLSRIWVKPDGASAAEGAYLRFPFQDLKRLIALESWRHRAIVLGEDLGTLPDGFQPQLEAAGILGMRVLWFERWGDGSFKPPHEWSRGAVGMTSTHDLPTVAGWWRGHDLDVRAGLGLIGDEAQQREARAQDRARLWQAFTASGAATGDPPPPDDPGRVTDAALVHVGRSACELVMVPIEDALAQEEQPNLPGTLNEHPNWRRRLPLACNAVLDAPEVASRIARLDAARRGG
jgi:4-alpha-glucanotransferase